MQSKKPSSRAASRPAKFWPALGLAALTGARATTGPMFLADYLSHRVLAPGMASSPLRFLARPGVASVLKLLTAGELVGDKLPTTEDRIVPQQLSTRAASGALVGATWYKSQGGSALKGALVGGLGAVAATFLTYYLRKNISEKTGLNTSTVGAGEDALVLAGGVALTPRPQD
ncbi:DUF4126 family protein [Hymenobacter sp. BRD67]|uniref:DUF4126 family protein n=1 Tax=Hymenobacter sp. BRD67 TaxID=2675877 RepID=UPI001566B5E2|nr:DUF4126 family protein [Hymenobacter sp. BRD67]QKG54225.1 DUF4126 family protein [Hymenobacter sp. BRD67]